MPVGPATVRVLVVDDDQDDCVLVSALLGESKRATFIVDAAYSPSAAMAKLKEGPQYDVLIVDWKLDAHAIPTTGLDFKRDLEAKYYRIPVILVTNHGDRELQAMAMADGVAEYLEKGTFTADLLERTCLYAIGLHERQQANGGSPGMGMMMQELVTLTRASVNGQTETKNAIEGMRGDFKTKLKSLEGRCDARCETVSTSVQDLTKEVKDKDKLKWGLTWVDEHRATAGILFGAVLVTLIVLALLLQVTDVGKLVGLKEVVASHSTWTEHQRLL